MPLNLLQSNLTAAREFGPFSRDLRVTFSSADLKIVDVLVSLQSSPGTSSGQCVNDLRLSFDGQDITALYVSKFHDLLVALPAARLEGAYRGGVRAWWKFAQTTGDFDSAESKAAVAQALNASAADLVTKCAVLGDTTDKCRGNLHPLNYAYNFIPLPPIALSALLPASTTIVLGSQLVISHGVAVSDPRWVPGVVGGGVNLGCLLLLENSLSELEQTVTEIESIMSDVYSLVVINGPLYTKLIGISTAIDALRTQMNDCTVSVGTPAQISVINNTLTDIKKLLHLQD